MGLGAYRLADGFLDHRPRPQWLKSTTLRERHAVAPEDAMGIDSRRSMLLSTSNAK